MYNAQESAGREWGGRTGKFALSSLHPLCSFSTAGIRIKGGLVN